MDQGRRTFNFKGEQIVSRATKRARDLLADHGVSKAPTPIEKILKSFNISVIPKPFDSDTEFHDVSGLLYRKDGNAIIGVNASHPPTRQRFTLAHELGHFLLHKGALFVDAKVNFRDKRSGMGIDRDEIEANAFAAELLMPEEIVTTNFKNIINQSRKITESELVTNLAENFKVSDLAMEFRLKNLGLLEIH